VPAALCFQRRRATGAGVAGVKDARVFPPTRLQITINRVHLRYEDENEANPFSLGATLECFRVNPWRDDAVNASPASPPGPGSGAGAASAMTPAPDVGPDAVSTTSARTARWKAFFKRSVRNRDFAAPAPPPIPRSNCLPLSSTPPAHTRVVSCGGHLTSSPTTCLCAGFSYPLVAVARQPTLLPPPPAPPAPPPPPVIPPTACRPPRRKRKRSWKM
jgi:hypothetical protein